MKRYEGQLGPCETPRGNHVARVTPLPISIRTAIALFVVGEQANTLGVEDSVKLFYRFAAIWTGNLCLHRGPRGLVLDERLLVI